jgi:hypothetical protein
MKVNLGCGRKKLKGYTNVDNWRGANADITQDCLEFLKDLPDKSVDTLYTRHFLEHINKEDLQEYMAEISRVIACGGKIKIIVPHWSNPAFYSDPTHCSFFGLYTMNYFCSSIDGQPYRNIPSYAKRDNLHLIDANLQFIEKRFPGKHVSILLNRLVNLNWRSKHIYETRLSGIIPCYQIVYTIRHTQGSK